MITLVYIRKTKSAKPIEVPFMLEERDAVEACDAMLANGVFYSYKLAKFGPMARRCD